MFCAVAVSGTSTVVQLKPRKQSRLSLEETLDISDIFAAAIALPRQTAAKAELAAEADGDDGADIGDFHENLRPALLASQASR